MAKIFLDTNVFIDALHRKPQQQTSEVLEGHSPYISTLSVHIYCYIFKIKLPNASVAAQIGNFLIEDFSESILDRALEGPTTDFEDNVQLHSSAEADCDFFVTRDEKLLQMKFFGKMQIINPGNLN